MLQNEIIEAKKINIALKAVNKKNEWRKDEPTKSENDFRITLSEDDKERLLSLRNPKRELTRLRLHKKIVESVKQIFDLEKVRQNNDNKTRLMPTKDAAILLNESSELLGLLLKAHGIGTSQIRKYLDSLRKIKADTSPECFNGADVLLQQVKIAYATGRNSDLGFLYETMKPAIIEGSNSYSHFEQLLRFMEAIVAYHRFYKGED